MKKLSVLSFWKRCLWLMAAAALLALGLGRANAAYINRFSTIANGAVTFTGNTLGLDKAANANAPGTSGAIGTFTSTNLSLVDGTYPPGTTSDWRLNSSAAQLVIPPGSTILYAELIWSGSYSYGGEDVSASINNSVGFLTPTGSTIISPSATTAQTKGTASGTGTCTTTPCFYVRSADVTSLVLAAGAGTYTISGVPATQGNAENNANAAGWTLAVVYQNGSMPSRNLSLFVGAEIGGSAAATITGFCTPPSGPRSGRLLVSAMEGDSSVSGDQMQFGASAAALTALNGPNNNVSNFFAGQINGDSGLLSTSGTFGTSNHPPGSSSSGSRQGYDIANVDVSAQLANNQTSAAARGTTTGDQYLINALALQINVGAPIFPISTKSANLAVAKVGDLITYTVAIDNRTGTADATNVVFRDPLPAGLSYVPGSFTMDGVVNPGNPVTGANIGSVVAGAVRTAVFKARVDSIPSAPALAQYDNAASWDYEFVPCAGQPVSRGSLTTNPATTKIARLLPSKSATPAGSVSPNDVITYTVTLKNDGTADSSGTTLADPIPANTSYVPGTTRLNGNLVSDIGGVMPFLSPNLLNSPSVGSGILATAQSAVVTFQVRVNSTASGTITNTAIGDIDGNGAAPSSPASVSNVVGLVADLSVVKTGPAALTPAGNVAYNIVISNAGPGSAHGASFVDNLPSALLGPSATCSASSGGAVCPASIGVAGSSVTGTIATLPAGGSVTLQIIATVSATATGNIANAVSVSPPAGTSDPNAANNSSTATSVVNPVADLVVTKSGPSSSSAGSALTYQVVIRNDGPSAAHGASFSDVVPATITGVTASCASALAGAICPSSVGVSGNTVSGSIPTLPAGGSVTLTIGGTVSVSAIGSITNTASVSPPGGTIDPNAANSSSTANTSLGSVADVSIAKTGPSALVPGSAVNYSLVVSNAGPGPANGTSFTDSVPSAVTGLSASCSNAQGGAACPPSVSVVGNVVSGVVPTLPAGASVTININGTVGASATGTIVNSASVTPPSGTIDPTLSNNGSSTAGSVSASADLSILKTGPATIDAGSSMSYTVVLRNNGPSDVFNASFSDNSPADLSGITASCASASGGALCPTGFSISGSNIAATLPQMPVGSSVVLTITGTVSGSATGSISNAASVATPASTLDSVPANNNSSVTTTITPVARLSISKTGPAAVSAGTGITYNLVISNSGPSAANGASFSDAVPATISGVTASCGAATGGAVCPVSVAVSGSNVVSGLVPTLPAGSSVTMTIAGTVGGTASGSITNSATVTAPTGVKDPDLSDNSSSTNTPVSAVADIRVSKFAPASVNAGGTLSYTIQISNVGPGAANSTGFSDVLNGNLIPGGATCGTASGGAVCPGSISISGNTVSGNIPTLPSGGSVVITITAQVSSSASGVITNRATISPAAGVTDPDTGNNFSDVSTTVNSVANLSISKVGPATVNAAGSISYALTIVNAGPSAANGATLSDVVPAQISGIAALCGSAAGGAVCPASLSVLGNTVTGSLPTLPAGSSLVVTVTGTVAPGATGAITNSASITNPAGVNDPDVTNNTSTVLTAVALVANIAIQKFGPSSFSAGGAISYTLRISNAGPSSANGTTFSDLVPAAISGVAATCGSASAGAVCPGSMGISGNTVSGAVPTLPSGGSVVITITGTVAAGASGTISNTATLGLPAGISDPDPSNNTSTVSTPVTPTADLSMLKTAPSNATPGSVISYTLVISNAGPSSASGAAFNDLVNAAITGVSATCASATNGAACPGSIGTAGNTVSGVIPTLPANSSVTLIISGTISASATGLIANTATVTPPAGTLDPSAANNSSSINTVLSPTADLQVSKVKLSPAGALTPGQSVQYQIDLVNNGPSNANGVSLSDPLPTGLTSMAWTCTATGSADCDSLAVGSGALGAASPSAIALNNISLPAGAVNKVTIIVTGTVAGGALGSVTNTVLVSPPAGTADPVPGNNTASAIAGVSLSADVTVAKSGPATVNAGATISYSIVVSNVGPSAADGTSFSDNVPAGVTGVSALCGSNTNGAICPGAITVAGNNVSAAIPTLPATGSVIFTITGTVSGTAPNSLVNTASVILPPNVSDPTPGNNSSVSSTVVPVADLVVKKVGPSAVNAGAPISYSIALSNTGPSPANNASLVDTIPASIGSLVITCAGETGGAVCPSGISNSNALNLTIPSLPSGSSLVVSVSGVVSATATGSITNTATITPPVGTIDPNLGNNSSTEVTNITPTVNVSIVKGGSTTALAGGPITYTLNIANAAGVSSADDTTFADVVPASITGVAASCASATGGAVCPSSITVSGNSVNGSITTLPAGGALVITITGTVKGSATGSISNTASVTPPTGAIDSQPTNNSDTFVTNIGLAADVRVQKTASASVQPLAPLSYTIVVTNDGPSVAHGTTLNDVVPSSLSNVSVTCGSATGGAVCPSGSLNAGNNVSALINNLPANSSLSFTVTGTVIASATGIISNTATLALPGTVTDPSLVNNSSTAATTVNATADLSVLKTGPSSAQAGGPISYTVTLNNAGPSAAGGTSISDLVPSGITGVTAACTSTTGGAACPAAVNVLGNNVTTTVPTLPAGSSVTLTVSGSVSGSATGTFTNTATLTPPANLIDSSPGNTSTVTTTVSPVADLSLLKTGPSGVNAAGAISYQLKIRNAGPSSASGASFTDLVPASIIGVSAICLSATNGATCPAPVSVLGNTVSGILANMPNGSEVILSVSGVVVGSATGSMTNTASVSGPAGTLDPNPADNSSTVVTGVSPVADLQVVKTGPATANAGGTISYNIRISNAGPSAANNAQISDLLPGSLVLQNASCAITSGGALCPASILVNGNQLSTTLGVLPAGGVVNLTVNATVVGTATGVITNSAQALPPAGVLDPDNTNNTSSANTTVQLVADVRATKTGPNAANAGSVVNYTVVVVNSGPSAANGTLMSDLVPGALSSVSASCTGSTGGASCATPSVVGNLVQTTLSNLPAGGTVSFNIQGTVTGGATGSITNSVTVTAPSNVLDPDPTNNTALSSSPVQPVADVRVEKSGPPSVNAGGAISYSLLITNAGPSSANLTNFSDVLPADITGVSAGCGSTANGAVCPGAVTVVGNSVSGQIPTLPAGGSLIVSVNGTVKGTASAGLSNTATVTVDASVIDPGSANNQSTVTTSIIPVANLSLVKLGSNAANAGGPISYTLTVSNAGPSTASGATLLDDVPTSVTGLTATCAGAQGGATCPASVGIVGNTVSASIPSLPAGGSIQITINGSVVGATTGSITNSAKVSPPAGTIDPDTVNNTGSASTPITPTADLKIEKFVAASHNAGDPITYTVKVTNLGPSMALGSVMSDSVPLEVTGVSASCAGEALGAVCPVSTSVVGNAISALIPSMPAGSSLLFTIKGRLTTTASGDIPNVARIAAAVGVTDPQINNNDSLIKTNVTPLADLSVTKIRSSPGATVVPGASVTYQIVVRNAGPAAAAGVKLVDHLPSTLSAATWQCVATGNADCDTTATGTAASGAGNVALNNISVDGSGSSFVTITLTATVSAAAEGSIVNNAQLTPPASVIDPSGANNLASDISAVATTIRGHAFSDTTTDGTQSGTEANLGGLTVTLTPLAGGPPIVVTTDSNGDYTAPVSPGADYSAVISAPPGQAATTRNNPQMVHAGNANTMTRASPVGFVQAASISGSVWRDSNHDRQRNSNEAPVAQFKVEVLDAGGQVVGTALTDANGNYTIAGLTPSISANPATHFTVRFRDPANNVLFGKPVSQDGAHPNGLTQNGLIEGLVLLGGTNTSNQSLPLDPSGVVYDSSTRQPVAGAVVQLVAPAGFNPSLHLLGGAASVSQTTGPSGAYQYLLLPGAPSGTYSLSITAPANYISPSAQIPVQSGEFSPPSGLGVFAMQAQEFAPSQGQSTTYYLAFKFQIDSQGVVNNHIPLDPAQPSTLFVTKSVDRQEAELGDSVLYTVSIRNSSGPTVSAVTLADRLPAGFRFIPGTAQITHATVTQVLANPQGGVGPNLNFAIGSVASGDSVQLTYRVRLGVGSQQGDGVNRAQAVSSNTQSNVAQARVKVLGGAFTQDACVVGKIFVDCNGNHLQDPEELGVPGVRLYMEDGTWLVSDTEGKYSFCGLKPITHVIKVDRRTLPVGAELATSSNRNALDANSLFIDTKFGELHRADFIEGTCKPEVVKQVKARRAQGRVAAPETERKTAPGLIMKSTSPLRAGQGPTEQKMPSLRSVEGAEPGGVR